MDFEYTSQRKGFERFHTEEIKKWVNELEEAEEVLKQVSSRFIIIIEYFAIHLFFIFSFPLQKSNMGKSY